MNLICPKCQGTMRTYERNGVHVDQCTECRGIFLDRGELERLVDAENAWHGGPAAAAAPGPYPAAHQPSSQPFPQPSSPGHQQAQPAASLGSVVSDVLGQVRASSSHGGSSHGSGHQRKRKDSFLGDLFG